MTISLRDRERRANPSYIVFDQNLLAQRDLISGPTKKELIPIYWFKDQNWVLYIGNESVLSYEGNIFTVYNSMDIYNIYV